jgi:hypothetical protein
MRQFEKGEDKICEVGPRIDFKLRRNKIAAKELYKQATKKPKLKNQTSMKVSLTDVE